MEVLLGVRLEQARRVAVELDAAQVFGSERARQGLEHAGHERLSGDGVVSLDVRP